MWLFIAGLRQTFSLRECRFSVISLVFFYVMHNPCSFTFSCLFIQLFPFVPFAYCAYILLVLLWQYFSLLSCMNMFDNTNVIENDSDFEICLWAKINKFHKPFAVR